ncbi:hypothetical protein Q5M85_06225 [Paraclostridium bifermentans]|nr:hypothetical protein [Paraclostridium bifermentans]
MTVYDGGWNEWQMHGNLPVQVGDPNSGDCQYTTVDKLPTDKAAKINYIKLYKIYYNKNKHCTDCSAYLRF